jgi:hypothetical protein
VGAWRPLGRRRRKIDENLSSTFRSGDRPNAEGCRMNVSGREEVLLGAFRFVRRNMLGGDYLEFGVYRGHTIHLAYAFSEYMSKSVQGWPPTNGRS